jgi:thioredoxin reductase
MKITYQALHNIIFDILKIDKNCDVYSGDTVADLLEYLQNNGKEVYTLNELDDLEEWKKISLRKLMDKYSRVI